MDEGGMMEGWMDEGWMDEGRDGWRREGWMRETLTGVSAATGFFFLSVLYREHSTSPLARLVSSITLHTHTHTSS